jgi:hypothetical protein
MYFILGAATALSLNMQIQVGTPRRREPIVRDSTPADSGRHSSRTRGVRRPVTPELASSAFKDATARATLIKARAARLRQDSALVAYDAMSYQRISVGMGFSKIGRDRLVYRHESAARIRWQDNVGVWVDVKGARTAIPIIGSSPGEEDARQETRDEMHDPDMTGAIPYYPGYEPLWIGGDMARSQVNESELVHPIADGAEAYYTYETGDSISFRLPDGKTIQLRELRFRPRQPKWNLVVGSLWFDTASGQLVRAAYRLSIPMDIWAVAQESDPHSMDDVPIWVKPMISPMRAEISAIAVEYSLHEGRFWLPRLRLAEGNAQVSFMHVPLKMEESFTYASVNVRDSLPPLKVVARRGPPDSLTDDQRDAWRDSVRADARAHVRAANDSIRKGLKQRTPMKHVCDTADVQVTTTRRYDQTLTVGMRVPCDMDKLEHSPDLPPSIYDPGEELFGTKELESLKSEALSLSAQAPLELNMRLLPPPTVEYGPSMMRYNRVEGLSVGISGQQEFGGGYSALGVARLGLADREPNLELTLSRSNVSQSIHVSGYNRLVSASDWGHPLSFGSSFSSLMFGRDEGFYYRASGLELGGASEPSFGGGARIEWRAFLENQRTARTNTNFALDGADFPANIESRRASYGGFGARITHSYGLDPNGLRLFTDARFEAAANDSVYGRGALDLTATHGLGRLATALTLSGGSSVGALPPQRRWFLGGSQTVRGQSPDTAQSGNAFWLTRLEIGTNDVGARPTIFSDLGWVGDRNRIRDVGRPMSGVGAGMSFLDGLFRFDVARGIYPRKQFRVDLYLESKF